MSAHIFIAEDEAAIITLLKYNLEKEGYKVSFCENGEDALKQIKDKLPDLILMDWMLPDLSGVEICKNLRDQGLLSVPAGNNVLRFLPPLNIEYEHVETCIEILKQTLDHMMAE